MKLSAMINQVEFRLGNKKNLRPQIEAEILLAQNALERDPKLNLWFLFKSFVFQSYLTERTYPMPNDFVKMAELYQPYFMDQNNSVSDLKRKPAHMVFRPTQTGTPQWYGLEASMFITDVNADGVYRIFYFASDKELISDLQEENEWTRAAPLVLILRAAMNVAKTLRDFDAFNTLNAEYQVEYKNLHDMCVAQEDFGFDITRGEYDN
jgi:hypothetical protein